MTKEAVELLTAEESKRASMMLGNDAVAFWKAELLARGKSLYSAGPRRGQAAVGFHCWAVVDPMAERRRRGSDGEGMV